MSQKSGIHPEMKQDRWYYKGRTTPCDEGLQGDSSLSGGVIPLGRMKGRKRTRNHLVGGDRLVARQLGRRRDP